MKTELNVNMIIAQLRKASYELGYANGRIDALRDFMNTSHYSDSNDVRAVLGIPKEEPAVAADTKDSLEDALGYTE